MPLYVIITFYAIYSVFAVNYVIAARSGKYRTILNKDLLILVATLLLSLLWFWLAAR